MSLYLYLDKTLKRRYDIDKLTLTSQFERKESAMIQVPHTDPNDQARKAGKATITRIDFAERADGAVVVNKYAEGWTASTPPFAHEVKVDFDLEAALEWCKNNNWIVRRWGGQARAWRHGHFYPVRTGAAIMRRRTQLQQYPRHDIDITTIDLAYDL